VYLIRNPRGINWGSFKEDLRDWLERGPEMDMKSEAGLGLAIHWVQHALVLAYKNNCLLRPVKMGRQSLKWTTELESLRRGVRRLFNACRSNKNLHSWDLYREAQRNYRKEVRKASKNAWRAFCSSTDDLPRSAKLHRALSRDPKIKLGFLVAPTGRRTQSEEETLELLHTTHFPNSEVTQEAAAPAATLLTRRPHWRLAMRVVTYRGVEWAIDSFAPYKSPGVDGIFPALLQQAREVDIPYLVRIFRACLATGYVPAIWRQVKVVFIPKPSRNTYSGPRDYRPISLTSFLLKAMKRLVDRYLRDEALAIVPLHPNQHAYQARKSVETALHQLVVRVEKALDQQEIALGAFLDIKGAFNNTRYDTMCDALVRHGSEYTIMRQISATLEGRVAVTTLNDISLRFAISRGCPQEGVLSPLVWCLVVNDLITRLSGSGFSIEEYADDICLLAVGKFPNTVSGLMQWALSTVEIWCSEVRLSVNPDKIGLVASTRKRKLQGFFETQLSRVKLTLSGSVKYPGFILDSRLTWKEHVEVKVRKAHNLMWACRRACRVGWGLGPKVVH
jgi:hypothetical protein